MDFPQTTVTTTTVNPKLRFDPEYVKSIPGALKIAAIILDLIGFICIMTTEYRYRETSKANFFNFVCMTGFWTSSILLVFYVFHVIEKYHVIPWLIIEFAFCVLWTFFYLVCSIVVAVDGGTVPSWAAAAFFGFAAMLVYAADAFFKFRGWKANDLAQGKKESVKSNVAPVSPPTRT